jgi:hypothetical protein
MVAAAVPPWSDPAAWQMPVRALAVQFLTEGLPCLAAALLMWGVLHVPRPIARQQILRNARGDAATHPR